MENINKITTTAIENSYTFSSCPPVGRYILLMVHNSVVRRACKAWKVHFGKAYYNQWMKIENNQMEPETFRKRLTVIREKFQKNNPLLKEDGFQLIRLCFTEAITCGMPKVRLSPSILKGGDQLRNTLFQLVKNASLFKLYSLDLSYNCFVKFPLALCSLENLTYLRLDNTQLEEIPKEIFQIKTLEYLYLHRNNLSTLPKEIAQLKNLRYLYVHDNQLTEMPSSICYLEKLFIITLQENKSRNKSLTKKRIVRIPIACVNGILVPYVPILTKLCQMIQQNELEKELALFFNFDLLKAERATKALDPLARLYEAIICQNKRGLQLKPFVGALSNEDKKLFNRMILKCEKEFNSNSMLLNYRQSDENFCFNVSDQVFDQAIVEMILQKSEKEEQEDIEMDVFHSPEIIIEKEELQEFEGINLIDLANMKEGKCKKSTLKK